jgi:hypothetical protein
LKNLMCKMYLNMDTLIFVYGCMDKEQTTIFALE